jgi:hypothetical protein
MTLQPNAQDANGHPIKKGDPVSIHGTVTALNPDGTISLTLNDGSTCITSKANIHYLARNSFKNTVGNMTELAGTVTELQGYGMFTEAMVEFSNGQTVLVKREAIQK